MARGTAARRYAKALFGLASDAGSVVEVREQMARLSQLLTQSPELHAVLMQPLHPVAQRLAVLKAVGETLGLSPLLRSFHSFLVDQRRLVEWDAIELAYGRLADAAAGLTKARVRCASALSDTQRERLQRALERRSGGRIQLEVEIDPGLVGGVVAQVGDVVYDGSLSTQLRQLRASLARS